MRNLVRVVVLSGVPSKVIESIVCLYSVVMTGFMPVRWWADKRQKDKAMNKEELVVIKGHSGIPANQARLKNFPSMLMDGATPFICDKPVNGAGSSKIGHFVSSVSLNCLPDFFHRIISLKMIPYEAHGRQVREPAFRSVELSMQAGL